MYLIDMFSIGGDPTTATGAAAFLQSPGGLAALGMASVLFPALGGLAWGARGARRRARLWEEAARQAGMAEIALLPGRLGVAGVCRGRAVKARLVGGDTLHVSACVLNPAHLLDCLSSVGIWSASALPEASWLSEVARAELAALAFAPAAERIRPRRRPRPDWQVRVRDRAVTLACAGVPLRPERIRFLIGLTCDLAESVDGFATLRLF